MQPLHVYACHLLTCSVSSILLSKLHLLMRARKSISGTTDPRVLPLVATLVAEMLKGHCSEIQTCLVSRVKLED